MLQIIKPTEAILINAIKLYIYGGPGIGKSSIAMTAKNALLLDVDLGAYRTGFLRRSSVYVANNWNALSSLDVNKDLEPYDTIIIDTVQRLLELIRAHFANDRKNCKQDGSLKLNVQGSVNTEFTTFVNRLISSGKDVIFIAHATEDKDGDETIIRPDLGGKNRNEIYRISDCMAFFSWDRKPQGQQCRFLKFDNSGEKYHSKDCASLGNVEVPDLTNNPTFLADLIANIKDHLNTMTPEQREFQEQEQSWIKWQQDCIESQYASEFNNLKEQLSNEMENPRFKQMWACLKHNAIKERGLGYDEQTKKFFETAA